MNDGGKEQSHQTLIIGGDEDLGIDNVRRNSMNARASFNGNQQQMASGAGRVAGQHSTLNIAIKARHASTNVMLSPDVPIINEKLGTYDSQAKVM